MKLKNSLLLLLTAAIWGSAFVAQSAGMDYVGPFTFNSIRSLIGAAVLVPLILFTDRMALPKKQSGNHPQTLILGGVCCGLALCLASNFQQVGIQYTTVGKAGFITACYIVIVPVMGLGLGKKCSPMIWVSVAMAVAGLYLLCMTQGLESISQGDILMIICAVMFSVHILVIDHFSLEADGVKLSCLQFLVSGLISAVGMVLFERPSLSAILAAWAPILYAGVMSCGVGYTLQIIGQKGMNPTVASLILSLESGISVLAGWILLGEKLSSREIAGCVVMFAAIILAQIPWKEKPVEDSREYSVAKQQNLR